MLTASFALGLWRRERQHLGEETDDVASRIALSPNIQSWYLCSKPTKEDGEEFLLDDPVVPAQLVPPPDSRLLVHGRGSNQWPAHGGSAHGSWLMVEAHGGHGRALRMAACPAVTCSARCAAGVWAELHL